jgi:phenylalanyl-tRNA synthetase beta chain
MLLGKKLTPDEWENYSHLFKGEIKAFIEGTHELKIELQDTNRPDLWCSEGIARQVSFKINSNKKSKYFDIFLPNDSLWEMQIDNEMQNIRPFAAGIAVKNINVTEDLLIAMIQTQEKIAENLGRQRETLSIGIYDLDAISFPVRYKAVGLEEIKFIPELQDRGHSIKS